MIRQRVRQILAYAPNYAYACDPAYQVKVMKGQQDTLFYADV